MATKVLGNGAAASIDNMNVNSSIGGINSNSVNAVGANVGNGVSISGIGGINSNSVNAVGANVGNGVSISGIAGINANMNICTIKQGGDLSQTVTLKILGGVNTSLEVDVVTFNQNSNCILGYKVNLKFKKNDISYKLINFDKQKLNIVIKDISNVMDKDFTPLQSLFPNYYKMPKIEIKNCLPIKLYMQDPQKDLIKVVLQSNEIINVKHLDKITTEGFFALAGVFKDYSTAQTNFSDLPVEMVGVIGSYLNLSDIG
jgi:hypothetical protein